MKYIIQIEEKDARGYELLRVSDLNGNHVMSTWDTMAELEKEINYWVNK